MAQMLQKAFRVREFDFRTDLACVMATWLNSFEPHRDRRVPRDIYYSEQHARNEALLGRAATLGTAIVACAKDEPTQIMGWLVGAPANGGTLDYVFVKGIYRKFGIGAAMLKQFAATNGIKVFTHYTDAVPYLKLAGLLPADATFNPYRLP